MDPRPRNFFIAILLALALLLAPTFGRAAPDASGRLVRTAVAGSYPATTP